MNLSDKIRRVKIPGATIVVPMLIGVVINSVFPQALQIGGFTSGMINQGTGPLVGVFMLFIGASLSFKNAPKALARGGVIIATKIIVSIILSMLIANFFNNDFAGLSSLAILGAMSVANNALYSGITATYGTEIDRGAVAMTTTSVGPTVTMIVLTSSGQANIPFWEIIGSILPLVLGMILANYFPYLGEQFRGGITPVIMVLGFILGANMNFQQLIQGGIPGILLGLIVVFIGGLFTIVADKATGGSGVAGAAISSTAASAVATPAAIAAIDQSFATISTTATSQIAAAVIVTSLLTPWLTSIISKQNSLVKQAH